MEVCGVFASSLYRNLNQPYDTLPYMETQVVQRLKRLPGKLRHWQVITYCEGWYRIYYAQKPYGTDNKYYEKFAEVGIQLRGVTYGWTNGIGWVVQFNSGAIAALH